MKQIKNLFSKLTKFFVKPMVLPVMLLFTSFGFGLRPVHAKSNQIEQSIFHCVGETTTSIFYEGVRVTD